MEFLAECDRKWVKIYGGDIDNDDSLESNLQVFISSVTSQKERENISRRTKEALKRRKEEGVILGRKKGVMKLDKEQDKNIAEIKNLIENGTKLYAIAKKYDVTPLTLTRFIKKHNLDINKPTKKEDINTLWFFFNSLHI